MVRLCVFKCELTRSIRLERKPEGAVVVVVVVVVAVALY